VNKEPTGDYLLITFLAQATPSLMTGGKIHVNIIYMSRTYQPKKKKRARTHGFRSRQRSHGGRRVLSRRRNKGRRKLTV
jgi:large subunit ribosomal protein L34